MITRRGWEALLAALVALLLTFYILQYLLVLVALLAFTFLASEILLFHIDTVRLNADSFVARRARSLGRYAVGTAGVSTIELTYQGRAGIVADAYDVLPDGVAIAGREPRTSGWWTPGSTRSLRARFSARIRGSYLLGPTVVVVRSRLGLSERRITIPTETPVQVVPENPMRKPGQLRRRIFTRVQGRMQLRVRGYGSEFRSLRPYQYPDEIRHVAWRRSTPKQLVVRDFEQESRQDIVLVLDVSPAMLAGQVGENALDRSTEAATLVAGFAQRSGEDRLGLVTYAGGVHQFLRPSRGAPHFRRIFENVALLQPLPGPFDLPKALDAVAERLHQGAHVLLFSAVDRPMEGLRRAHLRFKNRGHHLYVFLPDLSTFYPPPVDPAFAHALAWASEEDRLRLHRVVSELRSEAIPSFTFDRRGAETKVIAAYGQLRAWGSAG
ncbi:MAG: DUF58 domain-containing protein [Thermoplasmata archaeon]|nr:DUF58 domain-containing protein [Thermoplasmata archaeon]